MISQSRSMGPLALGVALLALILASSVTSRAEEPGDVVAAGERLVHNMDCNVCHTPKVMTEQGPQPDPARQLSGHPADEPVPEAAAGWREAGWGGSFNAGLTAWAGPWGVSFASNLTPDPEEGIGGWTESEFLERMRHGRFLPPMPRYDRLTDEELQAIFAYLRSLDPIPNPVPSPRPPA